MRPTLEPGDFVLVNERALNDKTPAVGDLVLARHPFRDLLIVKRVSQVDDGRLSLRGDNDTGDGCGRVVIVAHARVRLDLMVLKMLLINRR